MSARQVYLPSTDPNLLLDYMENPPNEDSDSDFDDEDSDSDNDDAIREVPRKSQIIIINLY